MEATLPIPGLDNDFLAFAIIGICICFVAFFSSSEASLMSANRIRLKNLIEKGNKNAMIVERIVSKHERLFSTILATENMFIIFASTFAGSLADKHFGGGNGVIISSFVMTIFIVIFGEITPKTFAAQHALKMALIVARPIEFCIKLLSPFIFILSTISKFIIKLLGVKPDVNPYYLSEDEIRMVINDGAKGGVFDDTEKEMLDGVFEFSKTTATEIMIPRVDMVTVEHDDSVNKALEVINSTGHSRIPVRKDTADNIIGVLYAKDILKYVDKDLEKLKISDIMRTCHFAPESQSIVNLLNDLRAKKSSIAILIDEFGGTAGLITMETLVEEIVGDIDDEFDTVTSEFEIQSNGDFLVDAKMAVYDASEKLHIKIPEGDYQTIGGFLINILESIPSKGDSAVFANYEMIVEKTEAHRLSLIRVKKLKTEKTEKSEKSEKPETSKKSKKFHKAEQEA